MSLRSGKKYLKEYTTTQQEAAGEEQQTTGDEVTKTKTTLQARDAKSQSSRASTRHSSTSSSAIRAYAKAKAAQAQIAFAEREAEMMKQKADLEAGLLKYDADLHLLKFKRAAAAAEAEASALEEVEVESGERSQLPDVDEEPFSTVQRTSEYVQQHMFIQEQPLEPVVVETHERKMDKQETPDIKPSFPQDIQRNTQPMHKDIKKEPISHMTPNDTYLHGIQRTANPEYLPDPNREQDFTRYLIRREMVSAGLLQFDDKPENYWAWKASFVSATKDLNLSAREELDLLTKWLGAESSEQAKRIRAVHVLNPAAGAAMVWQRLEECYGSPEVIEEALLKKIENFPRLTNKDALKLREL